MLLAFVLLLASGTPSCPRPDRWASRPAVDATPAPVAAAPIDADDAGAPPAPGPPRFLCVHQRRADLGAPAHREHGGHGGFVRLAECTRVAVIERAAGWVKGAFPLTEERTEGWLSERYLMDCEACEQPDAGVDQRHWPPQPRGLCQDAGPTGTEHLDAQPVTDRATVGGGARGLPGVKVNVATYNVWELYDGRGEERYLSGESHGDTPAKQYESRLRRLGRTLGALEIDVLLLQEVESATVACALAAQAWPRSGWSCYATKGRGQLPQHVALVTRLAGEAKVLRSVQAKQTGPRDGLELSLAGAGGLTITTVHLKSSRGRQGPADCANARQRMGAAAALALRYEGRSSVLIAGDFNMDPAENSRAIYDRTAEILRSKGFARLCPTAGCQVPTYPARTKSASAAQGSTIDLAFYRAGGRWHEQDVEVIQRAPLAAQTPLGSDHLPVVVTLTR